MCSAASFKSKNTYFGRNLDYEFSYGEKVVITPRHYPFNFRHLGLNDNHYAIIGMALVDNNYPMYYDALNEFGLAMAGLNFVGNAEYSDLVSNKLNVSQFEIISYILSTCKNIDEVKNLLANINIVKTPYNEYYPAAKLHFIIRDINNCIVVESMKDGLHVYDNILGCLTNNPPFNYQLENLKNYVSLNNSEPNKTFSLDDSFYSRGMGSLGLPGDLTSQGRFVRVAYTSHFSKSKEDEDSSVNQFFHILDSVCQTRGLCKINDNYEITIYSSCMNLNECIYYYKTYDNSLINAIYLKHENLNSKDITSYELLKQSFNKQN